MNYAFSVIAKKSLPNLELQRFFPSGFFLEAL